ncbi:MAG: DUF2807 domain-containing protein [Lentimicrobium sp.]|nr:DUF2807 domain-containing protein [Lentimicrobium sp.]
MKTRHQFKQATLVILNLLFLVSFTFGQDKGRGNVIKQARDVGNFSEIEAGSAFSLVLEQKPECTVTVETDDIYQNRVETVVEGNRLIISSLGMKNPGALKVWITSPDIKVIEIYGAARINTIGPINATEMKIIQSGASKAEIDLNSEILRTNLSGASKLKLSGNTTKHLADISGASDINALKMNSINASFKMSGASKATINSTYEIVAEISGASSLSYWDNGHLQKLNKPGSYQVTPENPSRDVVIAQGETKETTINGDSVLVQIGDISVEVHKGNPTKIKIGGNELEVDDEGNVKFKKNRQARYDGHWGGFEMGINGYVNKDRGFDMPAGYEFLDLRMEKSINVKVNFYEQNFNLIAKKLGFTTGLGFEWNNYRFDDNNVVLQKSGSDLVNNFEFFPANYTKSKLVVNYLNLPLMLEYQTNRHSKANSFHIGTGLQTGLRIGSRTKLVYQDNGNKKRDKNAGDFHINPFKFDAMVRIGWGKLNLYGNYSLNTLFKNNRGPELYPFSVGLSLISW